MNEKIGIVTVLYNCEVVLNDFFNTLEQQTYKNFELIIVDNASKDKSLSKCKELAKTVSFDCFFIENKENIGVAAGNNQGIKLALNHSCDKVLLSNNDIYLENNTIEELYKGHIDNKADLSVPKIFYYGTNKIWCAGGKFNRLKGTTIHFGYGKDDSEEYNVLRQVEYSPTCFMLINSDVFSKVGLMDEKYFVYYDDTDFVYRSTVLNNLALVYIPKSLLQHKVSYSTSKISDFALKYKIRNQIYFIKKYKRISCVHIALYIIYHFSIRNIKYFSKRKEWKLITKAIFEGIKL